MKEYRDNGAVGALLDEYEKAINELDLVIRNVTHRQLITIVDEETNDEDCRSIQTILAHVIGSGYTYVIEMKKHLGDNENYRKKEILDNIDAYREGLRGMFHYTAMFFNDYPTLSLEEYDPEKKIAVRWGQIYDVEQLVEHAIVHILRHRRQIERFILKMRM